MAGAIIGGLASALLPMIAGKIFGKGRRPKPIATLVPRVSGGRRRRKHHHRVRGRGILPSIKTRGRGLIRVLRVHRHKKHRRR